jgi:4-alpha-glucanotransferase
VSARVENPLRELAARAGICDEYFDHEGRRRVTSDETRRAILHALGVDATTDDAAREALARQDEEAATAVLDPVRVVAVGDPALARLTARAPASRADSGPWRLEVETEQGARHLAEGPWRGETMLELALPADLPLGYHRVTLSFSTAGREWRHEQLLIIVPPRCTSPEQLLGDTPAFGFTANLYTVRSHANWGVGDISDLSALARWAGSVGADFVGVNPLHALLNRGGDVSPYCPVSRLFRNPLYIDVTRVPELGQAPDLAARLASTEFAAELDALREPALVRYEQVMAVKGMALDALHRVFADQIRGSANDRDRAFERFVIRHGEPLDRFAIWMTIVEREHTADWRAWPCELQSATSQAVRRFARDHAHRVDFHRWSQFELDRQLGDAAQGARAAGMRIGLYQDLAIGSSPAGADTWAFPELFVRGVSVGAPPDPYAAEGQNWGLPPLDPRALRRDRYRYFIDLVRNGLRHAGALRVDHVMGLFRLFWIPDGGTGADGAYVTYPAQDLLGILALESVRHAALVVGEDLGTVPAHVPDVLRGWGVLSSKVLYFEREWDGGFRPASSYPALSLATANTHDMPTIAGFWAERDIELRRQLGLIADDDEETRARADRDRDRAALLGLLAREQILPQGQAPRSSAELRAAVHEFLWSTPAQLVGLSLDDLAGEVEPVNVPGVGPDKFASWTRKMRSDLESITTSNEADNIPRAARNRNGSS